MDYSRKIVCSIIICACFLAPIFLISDGGNCMWWNDIAEGDGTSPPCCYRNADRNNDTMVPCVASGVYMSAFL